MKTREYPGTLFLLSANFSVLLYCKKIIKNYGINNNLVHVRLRWYLPLFFLDFVAAHQIFRHNIDHLGGGGRKKIVLFFEDR
jgi:hypothetical protein